MRLQLLDKNGHINYFKLLNIVVFAYLVVGLFSFALSQVNTEILVLEKMSVIIYNITVYFVIASFVVTSILDIVRLIKEIVFPWLQVFFFVDLKQKGTSFVYIVKNSFKQVSYQELCVIRC